MQSLPPWEEPWGLFLHSTLLSLLHLLYVASLGLLTIYALWYISSLAAFLSRGPPPMGGDWVEEARRKCWGCSRVPRVAVVYPVFNDYEILSSVEAALHIDYPDYIIVIADDSTDSRLARILSNYPLRYPGRVFHLRRFSRRGLKAGALNDVAKILAEKGVDYMLVLDADFEPEPMLLWKLVGLAEEYNADIVQGHQAHRKGVHDVFGTLYKAAMGGAILFMTGRRYIDMFPIFTGSVGLLRLERFLEVPMVEDTISEDLRWTMDYAADYGLEAYVATPDAEAVGSVPTDLRAYWKQQIRWSQGTTRELLRTLWRVLFSKSLSLTDKLGYILQGLFYGQGVYVYASTFLPLICKYLFSCILGVWPLGLFIWFIGIATVILAGGLMEKLGLWDLARIALFLIPFIYYTSLIHLVGFTKALLGGKGSWTVTPKRGENEILYKQGGQRD